jgi:hypothetical protein
MTVGSKANPQHMRYRKRARFRHSKVMLKFISDLQALLNGTGAAKVFTAAASAAITSAAHGLTLGSGPYIVSNSGGALPSPYVAGTFYWVVAVPDANTLNLGLTRGGAAIVAAGAGTGTHTLTKASTAEAVFQLLKRRGSAVMKATTDVDNV